MKKLASRKDTRIIDLLIAYGPLGYGIYALLVEYLKERKAFRSMDDVNRIAYELHADADILRAIITDFNLFEIIEGKITHKKVSERKAPAQAEISEDSEISENSDLMLAEAPETEVSIPVPEPVSASGKRRARRKRLREHWSHQLID